jgi:hypothetical protein
VGSGSGKFCIVAGVQQPTLQIHGIEQRPRLVRLASRLARGLGAENVRFTAGNAAQLPWDRYDGFYFFNPFAENVFHERDRFDDSVALSTIRFSSDLLQVESQLEQARAGTVIVTYHGLGGPIPSSYELVADELGGSARIRTWVQGPRRRSRWAWFEGAREIMRVSHRDLRCALATLISESAS